MDNNNENINLEDKKKEKVKKASEPMSKYSSEEILKVSIVAWALHGLGYGFMILAVLALFIGWMDIFIGIPCLIVFFILGLIGISISEKIMDKKTGYVEPSKENAETNTNTDININNKEEYKVEEQNEQLSLFDNEENK